MTSATILSFLAQKHISQREVVASDGLVYLLQRSPAAREPESPSSCTSMPTTWLSRDSSSPATPGPMLPSWTRRPACRWACWNSSSGLP